MPACAPARLLPPVCLARCASVRLRPRPACHRRASVRLSPARSSVSGSARGFSSGTGAGRPSPPGSFASPAPRPPARSGRLSRRHALDPGGPFSVLFLERGSKGNGSDRIGPPPTSSREAFTKEKDEKAEQLSRPRAAGRGGLSAGRPGDERAAAR